MIVNVRAAPAISDHYQPASFLPCLAAHVAYWLTPPSKNSTPCGSKASVCVHTRSRNQRSCETTSALPAKSCSASSSERSVSTSWLGLGIGLE